jgi:hypothetical protein
MQGDICGTAGELLSSAGEQRGEGLLCHVVPFCLFALLSTMEREW